MTVNYVGYRLAQWLSLGLPPPVAFRCAEQLADVQWRRANDDRHAVQANLELVLGTSVPEGSPLVREVFRNFGRYLVEFFTIHRVREPEVHVEGYEHLMSAQHRNRGTILLTAHLGNWELGAVFIRRMGFPVAAVALPHEDPRMDRLFNRQRQRCGVHVIPLGKDATKRSLRSLRDGQMLGILGDRTFTEHGISMTFCNKNVVLPRGPATLSLRSQAPVVPTFVIREGRWKFRLCFEQPIEPQTHQTTDTSVRSLTQMYAAVTERFLKRFPDQWLIFQALGAAHS